MAIARPENVATSAGIAPSPVRRRWHGVDNSLSTLVSLIVHMLLFLTVALLSNDGRGGVAGTTEEVWIGNLEVEPLTHQSEESLDEEATPPQQGLRTHHDELELAPAPAVSAGATFRDASDDLSVVAPSLSGGDASSFDIGGGTAGGGAMTGGSWDGMLQSLRRNGLDIVLTFDSTGSMSGEIQQVKKQLRRIGGTLLQLVPNARISICTYRDTGDEYVVLGTPLSSDLRELENFLNRIAADGGGDEPEAVQEGLRWSIGYNEFRSKARKVILLFGDAPPHSEHLTTCLKLASEFNGQRKGIVSTVTCRHNQRMPSFVDIAYAGGGEAFLTSDEKQIMTQLLVLVFGSQYRSKVVEAFQLNER